MKHLLYSIAIIFSLVLFSCNNASEETKTETTITEDSATSSEDTNTTEPLEQYFQMNEEDRQEAIEAEKAETENQTEESATPKTEAKSTPASKGNLSAAEMNGEPVELIVKSFDINKPELVLTIINRTDKALRNFRSTATPIDAAGESVTSSTGRDFAVPISRAQNPFIVDAKSKTDITLTNLGGMKRMTDPLKEKVKGIKIELNEYQDIDGTKTKK